MAKKAGPTLSEDFVTEVGFFGTSNANSKLVKPKLTLKPKKLNGLRPLSLREALFGRPTKKKK